MIRSFIISVILTIGLMSVVSTTAFAETGEELIAVLKPTAGNKTEGVVTFKDLGNKKVEVKAHITGLEPNSEHGFHIHQYGDLTSNDGMSTGGHFNPQNHPHALPVTEMRHAGDFGNIKANADGVSDYTLIVDNITLTDGEHAIIGRGLIVHAKADDGSQPVGNAGARIAAAVIGIKNPQK